MIRRNRRLLNHKLHKACQCGPEYSSNEERILGESLSALTGRAMRRLATRPFSLWSCTEDRDASYHIIAVIFKIYTRLRNGLLCEAACKAIPYRRATSEITQLYEHKFSSYMVHIGLPQSLDGKFWPSLTFCLRASPMALWKARIIAPKL